MPKVEISRSTSQLPTQTAVGNLPEMQFNQLAGQSLMQAGGAISAFAEDKLEKARLAEDSAFVANNGVVAQQGYIELRDRLQQQFVDNPKGYTDAFVKESQKLNQTILESAPSDQSKRALQSQLNGFLNNGLAQASAWERQSTIDSYIRKNDEAINLLTNQVKSNPELLDQSLAQGNELVEASKSYLSATPDAVAELSQGIKAELIDSALNGRIENKDFLAARGILGREEMTSLFSDREIQAKEDRVRDAEEAAIKETAVESERLSSEVRTTFEAAIQSADVIEAPLSTLQNIRAKMNEAREGGTLTIEDHTSLSKTLLSQEKVAKKRINSVATVAQALATGTKMDSTDADQRKAADDYYTMVVAPQAQREAENSANPEEAMAQTKSLFALRSGILPKAYESELKTGITSGSPKQKVAASANIMEILRKGSPFMSRQFSPEDKALATKIEANRQAGMKVEDAVEAAEAQLYEKETRPYQARLATFNHKDFDKTLNKKDIDTGIKGLWASFGVPDVPPAMQKDFEETYRAYMVDLQVPEERAKEMALKDTSFVWGVSNIGGKRWMKNSPEKMYGRGENTSWVSESINNSLLDLGVVTEGVAPREVNERVAEETLEIATAMEKLSKAMLSGDLKADHLKEIESSLNTSKKVLDRLEGTKNSPIELKNIEISPVQSTLASGRPSYNVTIFDETTGSYNVVTSDVDFEGQLVKAPMRWTPSVDGTSAAPDTKKPLIAQAADQLSKARDKASRDNEKRKVAAQVGYQLKEVSELIKQADEAVRDGADEETMRGLQTQMDEANERLNGLRNKLQAVEDSQVLFGGSADDEVKGGSGGDYLAPDKELVYRFFESQKTWEGTHGLNRESMTFTPAKTKDSKPRGNGQTQFDIGYGHLITQEEWDKGTIHGVPFRDTATGEMIPLSEDKATEIQNKDVVANTKIARKKGWDKKLENRGLSWGALPDKYRLPLIDLAYNVGPSSAQKWDGIFDAILEGDDKAFVGHLRRTDNKRHTEGMDNRAAKAAIAAGLISDYQQAREAGLKLAKEY